MASAGQVHVMRVALLVVVLASLFPHVLQPRTVTAREQLGLGAPGEYAEALPGVPPGETGAILTLAAACAGNLACVAAGLVGLAAVCEVTTGCVSESAAVVQEFIENWGVSWDAGGSTVEQFVNQYGEHSDHFVITQQMLDAWFAAAGEFALAGWSIDGSTWAEPMYRYDLAPTEEITLTSPIVTLTGAVPGYCQAIGSDFGPNCNSDGVSGVFAFLVQVHYGRHSDGVEPSRVDAQIVTPDGLTVIDELSFDFNGTTGVADSDEFFATDEALESTLVGDSVRIRFVLDGESGPDNIVALGIEQFASMVVRADIDDDGTGTDTVDTVYTLGALDYLFGRDLSTALAPGSTAYVPENEEGAIQGVVAPIPLANGEEGSVAAGAAGVGSPGAWYEGVWNGVKSFWGTTNNTLQNIYNAIQALTQFVTDFPTIMADLFVPTISLEGQITEAREALLEHQPFSWPFELNDIILGVFNAGDDCVPLPRPNISTTPPYQDGISTEEYCVPSGARVIASALAYLLTGLLVALWARSFTNRLLGD